MINNPSVWPFEANTILWRPTARRVQFIEVGLLVQYTVGHWTTGGGDTPDRAFLATVHTRRRTLFKGHLPGNQAWKMAVVTGTFGRSCFGTEKEGTQPFQPEFLSKHNSNMADKVISAAAGMMYVFVHVSDILRTFTFFREGERTWKVRRS